MPESSRDLKQKAGNLFNKVSDAYHGFKNQPPKPPPKPSPPLAFQPAVHSDPAAVNYLTTAFNGLSISNPTTPATIQTDPNFVGGFNIAGASASAPALSSPSRPPAMPMPFVSSPGQQSLTMQYALRPNLNDFVSIPLPPYNPQKPSGQQSGPSSPVAGPSTPTNLSPSTSPTRPSFLSTPTKHSSASASPSSPPSTPSGKTGPTAQCAGITKSEKRCTRQVKIDPVSDVAGGDEGEPVPRYCFQHVAEILSPSGYYVKGMKEVWVKFEDWIPPYLRASTQASLRTEMEKTRSTKDEPGCIYVYEIRDPDSPKTIKLKVGRAVNLTRRIDQWSKQCGSKEQVVRGYYPGKLESDSSLMKGLVKADDKTAWCHRLERLVHLELADLASTRVYLEPGWPHIDAPKAPSTPSKSRANGLGNGCTAPCPDCKTLHKEIFEFRKWEEGQFVGSEYSKLVKDVIERWGMFVEVYMSPPEV